MCIMRILLNKKGINYISGRRIFLKKSNIIIYGIPEKSVGKRLDAEKRA